MILSKSATQTPFLNDPSYTLLGSGGTCSVYKFADPATNQTAAVKVIPRTKSNRALVVNEIQHLKTLETVEGIVRLVGIHKTQSNYLMYMNLLTGGDLFEYWTANGYNRSEEMVSKIMFQMLTITQKMHAHNIAHNDLKLDNFVFADNTHQSTQLQLIDFGFASSVMDEELYEMTSGTLPYMPPEALHGEARDLKKGDSWALGVIAYLLLTGRYPEEAGDYSGDRIHSLFGNYNLSARARSFILKLLKINPAERATAAKVLDHPFITRHMETAL